MFFDFDKNLIRRALDKDRGAFYRVCIELGKKLDRIERKIREICPDWSTEHQERVRDLFVHDRFLKLFTNPPAKEIDDFNSFCWQMLVNCISDVYRYCRQQKRNCLNEQPGDAAGYGEDGLSTFWDAHALEIMADSGRLERTPYVDAEIHDLMRSINGHLSLMGPKKRRTIKLWMNGYTEREIAEELQLTIGNVGCIISRVISELRKKLCKNSCL